MPMGNYYAIYLIWWLMRFIRQQCSLPRIPNIELYHLKITRCSILIIPLHLHKYG